MRQAFHELELQTRGKGLTDVTREVAAFVREARVVRGLLTVFCRHTSASLLIQENADPDVQADLRDFFERLAPEDRSYIHGSEGPDDMPAHIRAALTQLSSHQYKAAAAMRRVTPIFEEHWAEELHAFICHRTR